ncbi:toll/interleukin-1 receptor-like protein [Punica granatum]|uniref:Toll/interleukin-1 receptor-like protein n=2 Tax=Punica granatum TaxID=22663 RepID=A0A6P8CK37_PUNGR|nr:toll/interleukin-1 receptor-like protein [Punica granatum]PKI53017.1 hypothetical protein CRG98_026597 [Punica granatum]
MAGTSASKSKILSFFKYDVFLCFHGKDTREGFTSYLHDALRHSGIKAFMDVQLPKGRPLNDLIEMIPKSRFTVVVFSENFASSEWCLDELARIVECKDNMGLEVLPVFYKVEPSELTDQLKGRTVEYLAEHGKRHGEKVQRWRRALKVFGRLEGLPYKHGIESQLVEDIIGTIHEKLNWKNRVRRRASEALHYYGQWARS